MSLLNEQDEALIRSLVGEMLHHFRSGEPISEAEGVLCEFPTGQERRAAERRPFPTVQAIAPCRGASPPKDTDFRGVVCRDLSTTGISFWCEDRPDYEYLVVRFGAAPRSTDVLARVMRLCPGEDTEPARRYLVGCRFERRVSVV